MNTNSSNSNNINTNNITSSDSVVLIYALLAIAIVVYATFLWKLRFSINCIEDNNINNNSKCIIPNSYYPEIENLIKHKEQILDELVSVIKSSEWSNWGKSNNDNELKKIPRFSEMSVDEKNSYLIKNKSMIGHENSWKLFGLILEKEPIKENAWKCLNTYELIKDIPGLINAGFSCLEPHSITPYHNDQDKRFYRVHIPLIIPDVPKGMIGLDVYENDNDNTLNELNWNVDYFVFDDTCYHQAYNNTDYHRIVLLLDIERRYF